MILNDLQAVLQSAVCDDCALVDVRPRMVSNLPM
jgi:hypothetical protein